MSDLVFFRALGKNSSAIYNFIMKLKPQELEKLDIVGVMESLEVVDGILRFLIFLICPQVTKLKVYFFHFTLLKVNTFFLNYLFSKTAKQTRLY